MHKQEFERLVRCALAKPNARRRRLPRILVRTLLALFDHSYSEGRRWVTKSELARLLYPRKTEPTAFDSVRKNVTFIRNRLQQFYQSPHGRTSPAITIEDSTDSSDPYGFDPNTGREIVAYRLVIESSHAGLSTNFPRERLRFSAPPRQSHIPAPLPVMRIAAGATPQKLVFPVTLCHPSTESRKRVHALLDTGASTSVVQWNTAFDQLNLPHWSQAAYITIGGRIQRAPVVLCRVVFDDDEALIFRVPGQENSRFITPLVVDRIDQEVECLIGLDILSTMEFVMRNYGGEYVLFIRDPVSNVVSRIRFNQPKQS